jgi:hypothetical protein
VLIALLRMVICVGLGVVAFGLQLIKALPLRHLNDGCST